MIQRRLPRSQTFDQLKKNKLNRRTIIFDNKILEEYNQVYCNGKLNDSLVTIYSGNSGPNSLDSLNSCLSSGNSVNSNDSQEEKNDSTKLSSIRDEMFKEFKEDNIFNKVNNKKKNNNTLLVTTEDISNVSKNGHYIDVWNDFNKEFDQNEKLKRTKLDFF